MTKRLKLLLLVVAMVLSLNVSISTGVIEYAKGFYSPSLPYRMQTDALLGGHLALSNNPADVKFDMAWAQGGVQQVWGLGVPFWRLPFEIVARAVGQPAFPDRLCLSVFIVLVAYICLCAFTVDDFVHDVDDWLHSMFRKPLAIVSTIILIAFPPVMTLCSGAFFVYEEAVVYSYFYAIALFAASVDFARRPRLWVFLVGGFLAGCAGFFRPTALAYGGATVLAMCFFARRFSWTWRKIALGPVLFSSAIGLLLWTNLVRFGAPLEFGHRLNLSGFDMTYISRFSAPFDDEPFASTIADTIGSAFFVHVLNGYTDCFANGLCAWQASAPRWRAFYSTTFDVSELIVLAWFSVWSVWSLLGCYRNRAQIPTSITPAIFFISSFIPLVGFYARYCSMSSRYIVDFAPAVAAALVGSVSVLSELMRRRKARAVLRFGAAAIITTWLVAEFGFSENITRPVAAWSQAKVLAELKDEYCTTSAIMPDQYEIQSMPNGDSPIFANGRGWHEPSGETGSIVSLFIEDPEKLCLEVAPIDPEHVTQADYDCIQPKIGLEFLERKSIEETPRGRLITFAGPKAKRYQKGVQVAFIKFLPPEKFRESEISPFKLLRVDWRGQNPSVGSNQ